MSKRLVCGCPEHKIRQCQHRVTIACTKCRSTVTLRPGRLIPSCDYYLCKPCDREQSFPHPRHPALVLEQHYQAAADFTGYTLREATDTDRAAFERAGNLLRAAGFPVPTVKIEIGES